MHGETVKLTNTYVVPLHRLVFLPPEKDSLLQFAQKRIPPPLFCSRTMFLESAHVYKLFFQK